MSLTVKQLIRASMRVAQVIEKGEEPQMDEENDALEALTIMLHSWSARRLLVRTNVSEGFPLVYNTSLYTIGVDKTFNTSKPYSIKSAFIRDLNNLDTGLDVVGQDLYDSFQDKSVSVARPEVLYYDPGSAQQGTQYGTIYLYPIVDNTSTYTLYINSQKPFSEVGSLTDDITFDLPYEEAIKYELAIRLWREYHKGPIPDDIVILANEAMHTVESMNAEKIVSGLDLPGMKMGNTYNIYVGGYND